MNVNYNFHRIMLLLRADWMEYKKSYLLSVGVLFAVWMLYIFVGYANGGSIDAGVMFWHIGMFVSLLLFCRHAGRKMHRPKGAYLLIPAGNGEKYTALLLESLVYFAGFQIVFWIGLLLWKAFAPGLDIPSLSQVYYIFIPNAEAANGSEAAIFFLSALLFLAYMSFRKHALLILTGGMVAYIALFLLIAWNVFDGIHIGDGSFHLSYLYYAIAFLADCYPAAMLISALVVMYVAYLKLKEKELR
ncbi:MAG: hypothetical protein LBP25_00210 [Tannerellaceae bacterium]|nr:hypothetical protein [Tannerellaceae bacterium]